MGTPRHVDSRRGRSGGEFPARLACNLTCLVLSHLHPVRSHQRFHLDQWYDDGNHIQRRSRASILYRPRANPHGTGNHHRSTHRRLGCRFIWLHSDLRRQVPDRWRTGAPGRGVSPARAVGKPSYITWVVLMWHLVRQAFISIGIARIRAAAVVLGVALAFCASAQEIGQIKTARGEVTIVRQDRTLPGTVGARLQTSDSVRTGADGSVGITMADDSLLSAGPNSVLSLDRFSFDPTTNRGRLDASVSFQSDDEVGELGRSLERMRASLKAAMVRLNRES